MKSISLNGVWNLRGKEEGVCDTPVISIPATVPGCVQLDLSENGYLPKDLYMGENIKKTEDFENYEWWYERSFDAPTERKNVYLVFEGVDCLAEYFLNGVKIGESKNAFIAHEFKIDKLLKDEKNTLTVHISSPILAAQNKDYTLKLLSSNLTNMHPESSCIRRPAHSYGWDIMPRAITSGLWRDVKIEIRDKMFFTQTFVSASPENFDFFYTVDCGNTPFCDAEIEIGGSSGDSSFYKRFSAKKPFGKVGFTVKSPKLWFPYGYGEPNVYDGYARILQKGEVIHEVSLSFGIRKVELDRRDAVNGDDSQFRFLINGVEIMCRGSNWVPMDAFHSRDAERYDMALSLVKDIGCNILRCWGGNVYEDHKFFDFCDRNGIMVWQDFAMACINYPEDDEFKKELDAEVTAVIRKLRQHPSIVLWAGDNEIDALSLYNPNVNSLTREVIPKCIELNDIDRPYLPSSPYISEEAYLAGQTCNGLGSALVENHLWGPRDYFKSDFYKENKAKFVSETGYHGCPSLESIKKFITPERVWSYRDNPEWTLHSSNNDGNDERVRLMEDQVRQLFGRVPAEPEKYILASQISQAEAKKYFIERMRVDRPNKTGIIWWNLLDGWPQMSDAVVDYYYTKKLAYEYIKRSQAPFSVAAGELTNWKLPVYACNDTLSEKKGHLKVTDTESGEILHECGFTAAKNATTPIANLPIFYSEQKIIIFEWTVDGERGFNHYLCGYPPFNLEKYMKVMDKYGL